MATLYVSEYSTIASVNTILGVRDSPTMAPQDPSVVEQIVAIAASSTQSSAFNPATHLIRVHSDSICSIVIGAPNQTATTNMKRLGANQTEYFGVQPGHVIAVIQNV